YLDVQENQTCLLGLFGHFYTEGMAIIKFYLLESLPERLRNSNARHYAAKKQPCKFRLARGIAAGGCVSILRWGPVHVRVFPPQYCAFLTHEAQSTPTPSYLVSRDLPARPAPDRFESCEKVRVLLQ